MCPPHHSHQHNAHSDLPPFESMSDPVFVWGSFDAAAFSQILGDTYSQVVHWRRNCFAVPLGKEGKEFVGEISRLFQAFASASALESVALRVATFLPILLLQKPHRASKKKEHITCLERGLKIWKEGGLGELVLDGRAIQHRLPKLTLARPKRIWPVPLPTLCLQANVRQLWSFCQAGEWRHPSPG